MSNEYYVRQAELAARTKAKGDQIVGALDAISAGFDKLPTPLNDGTGFSDPVKVGLATEQEHAIPLSMIEGVEASVSQDRAAIEALKNEVNVAKASVDQSEADINSTAAKVVANKNLSEQSKLDAQQAVLDAEQKVQDAQQKVEDAEAEVLKAQQAVSDAEQHSLSAEAFADASSSSAAAASQSSADTDQKRDDAQAYALQSEQSADDAKDEADRAANLIAMLPVGAIDDSETSPSKAWSSDKIASLTGADVLRDVDVGTKVPSVSNAALTGNPTATTQSYTNNSTRIATTAYVRSARATNSLGGTVKVRLNGTTAYFTNNGSNA